MDSPESRVLWVGGLTDQVTEELLYELFLQCGPVERVNIPKDKQTGQQRTFGFINFKHEASVPYSIFVMDGVKLFNRPLTLRNKTAAQMASAKNLAENSNYGLGLLPHPRLGKGVIPADLSEFFRDSHQNQQFSSEQRFQGIPHPSMHHPNFLLPMPMMLPPNAYMQPPLFFSPPGLNMQPNPQFAHHMRVMKRAQTWHGDASTMYHGRSVVEDTGAANGWRGDGGRGGDRDRSGSLHSDERHRDVQRGRRAGSPDAGRRNDGGNDKRNRYDGSDRYDHEQEREHRETQRNDRGHRDRRHERDQSRDDDRGNGRGSSRHRGTDMAHAQQYARQHSRH